MSLDFFLPLWYRKTNTVARIEVDFMNQIPDGFVPVTDIIPDVQLDIRYYSAFNFVGTRINAYKAPVALLTLEAAQALQQAANQLRQMGYGIKIYDAYRPQSAVDHFVAWGQQSDERMKPYFYPNIEKHALFELGYVAPKSGHSRGSTVDLTLVDLAAGTDVDMGTGFDFFDPLSHPTTTCGLTSEQIRNRNILRDAMVSCGFLPDPMEWWDFTLANEPYPDTYFDFPVIMPTASFE